MRDRSAPFRKNLQLRIRQCHCVRIHRALPQQARLVEEWCVSPSHLRPSFLSNVSISTILCN